MSSQKSVKKNIVFELFIILDKIVIIYFINTLFVTKFPKEKGKLIIPDKSAIIILI